MRLNRETWAARWLVAVLAGSVAIPCSAMAGTTRPLYVFAPTSTDARLVRQREINAAASSGFRERDMVVTIVAGPGGARKRFGVSLGEFRVVLVGKDGGVKLSSAAPVSAAKLFGLIDSMPMRRLEMRSGRR